MPFCRDCGKEVQNDWATCPYCSHSLVDSSQNVSLQDSVIMGDITQNVELSNNECPNCSTKNIRIMKCNNSTCQTQFCEICHPLCKWKFVRAEAEMLRFGDGKGKVVTSRFDSGEGEGPKCKGCLIAIEQELESNYSRLIQEIKLVESDLDYGEDGPYGWEGSTIVVRDKQDYWIGEVVKCPYELDDDYNWYVVRRIDNNQEVRVHTDAMIL